MSNSEYPDHPKIAVGAIVFQHNRVLLVRRKNPPSSGQWAVPGGKVKLGETLREAAEREILEETGIRIHAGKSVFTFEYIERDASEDIVFHYVIIDLEADYLGGDIHAADDALEARWLSSGQLKELNVNQTTRNLLKEIYNFG